MSTAEMLYLILCLAAFATFGSVLAYCSHWQSPTGRDHAAPPGPPARPAPAGAGQEQMGTGQMGTGQA